MTYESPYNPFVPLLKIDIEHTRHQLVRSLAEHTNEINQITTEAVNKFLTHDNLTEIINESVREEIPIVIKNILHKYFSCGEGYQDIENIIESILSGAKAMREKKEESE